MHHVVGNFVPATEQGCHMRKNVPVTCPLVCPDHCGQNNTCSMKLNKWQGDSIQVLSLF